jgi:hypothetical protein
MAKCAYDDEDYHDYFEDDADDGRSDTMDLKVNMMKPVFHIVNCTEKLNFYRYMRDT